MKFKVNNSVLTILKMDHPRVLVRTETGTQFCYNILNIKESDIIHEKEQLKLF
jgi:hypothetical protein